MLRTLARNLAYRTGAMELFHRVRNREALTVIMLHRVLPHSEQQRRNADPEYTITPELLAELKCFLAAHYNVVSLDAVLRSHRRVEPLPNWPVLLTFDDGWHDNIEYALPILGEWPWALFVASDVIGEPGPWWQDVLLSTIRSGAADCAGLLKRAKTYSALTAAHSDLPIELQLILACAEISADRRTSALAPYAEMLSVRNNRLSMLSVDELRLLHYAGVAIGAHGATHVPLTHCAHPEEELTRSRIRLQEILSDDPIATMSFPHGRWNPRLVNVAKTLGYTLFFTSEPTLNPCPSGWVISDVIGRISLSVDPVVDEQRNFSPELCSNWLYRRSRAPLA